MRETEREGETWTDTERDETQRENSFAEMACTSNAGNDCVSKILSQVRPQS